MASHETMRPEASVVSVNVKSPCVCQRNEINIHGKKRQSSESVRTLTVCTMEKVNTHTIEHKKPRHKLLREHGGLQQAQAMQT